MRIAIIVNPKAGSVLTLTHDAIRARLQSAVDEAGAEAEITLAEGAAIGDAIEAAIASGIDALIVGGGDGTVNGAAARLMGGEIALGVIPLGTMNLLAKDLEVPATIEEALPALLAGTRRRIDAAEVNGEIFLSSSLMGIAPWVTRAREKERREHRQWWHKWLMMARAAWQAMKPRRRMMVHISTDRGEERRLRTFGLAVVNNSYDPAFGSLLRRSALDKGELTVHLARHHSRLGVFALLAKLPFGWWRRDADLETLTAKEVTIDSRRPIMRCVCDGEIRALNTPLKFRSLPGALLVLQPAAATNAP